MRRGLPLLFALSPLLLSLACHRAPRLDPAAGPGNGWGATYRAVLQAGDEERRFRLALGVLPPDGFRLEIYGPVGGARLVIASDGRQLSAAAPGERLHASAPADPSAFEALLGLPLPGSHLLQLLEGRARGSGETLRESLEGGGQVLYRYERVAGLLRRARVEVRRAGRTSSFQAEYGDRAPGGWPRDLRLQGEGRSLTLRRRETVPGGPPEAALRLAAPPGFERVELARLGRAGARLFGGGA